MPRKKPTYAFIDASNLFYGGEKSLGWKIDYRKLIKYLRQKYEVVEAYYFGGIEIKDFEYDYLKNETVPLIKLEEYFRKLIKNRKRILKEVELIILHRYLQRVRFYLKLKQFGYNLKIKPVKFYKGSDGLIEKKANCDVEMTFYLMKEKENFGRVLILSGDGDFLPVLKYLRGIGKEVIVLARGTRTAKEIRQFAAERFTDFTRLEKYLKFE